MANEEIQRASLGRIFGIFCKIGAFTIGGGYAMIPVIESEMLRRKWIPREEIDDVVVLAQSAPGLLAVNMAIFTGYKLRGWKGSIVATLGAILPSFVIILAVASVLAGWRDNEWVNRFFLGLRPVAIALIAVPAVKMSLRSTAWWEWVVMVVTLVLVAVLKVSPIWILLVLIASSVAICKAREGRGK
ncbi:MAG: chromate transporter [Bacteroidales bacterium]|nr:chromate transporter [Candidatus Cryptobacteroides aphodequi]